MNFADLKTKAAKLLKRPPKVTTDEVAALPTDIKWFAAFLPTLDPALFDPTILSKGNGKGLELYDDVDRDTHASAVLGNRAASLIGKEWFLKPASEDKRDKEIAEKETEILKRTNFDEGRGFLMQSRLYGVFYTEVMWLQFQKALSGKLSGMVGIKEFIDKHPRKFTYTKDRELMLFTPGNMTVGEPVPDRKFIISRFGSRDIPYGKALGQRLWWYVWFKKNGIKFWLTFLEKFGSPSLHGKYPPNTSKPLQDDLLEALKALKNESGTVTANNMEIDLVESARRAGAGNPYMDLTNFCNSEISKAVLGQTLTTEQGRVGSMALGNVHEGVRQDILVADASLEAEMFNTSLIPWLTVFNFLGAIPPRFVQRVEPEQDLKSLAERDKALTDAGFRNFPISYFHDTYNIRRPEDGEEVLPVAVAPPMIQGQEPPQFADPGKKKLLKKGVTGLEAQNVVDVRVDVGVSEGVSIFNPTITELERALNRSESYEEFRSAADQIIDTLPLDDLRESVSQFQVETDFIGQDAVVNELTTDERKEFDEEEEETSLSFADARFGPGKPFETALEFYRSKNFEMAGDIPEELKQRIGKLIEEAQIAGTTYKDFIKEAGQLIEKAGFSAFSPWRLETIYRTNMQTAYQAGRYIQMTSSTLLRVRPFWRYVAVMDSATRPSHAAMHNKVYPANHPIWNVWYPPNGFNCRCYISTASEDEFRRRRLVLETADNTGNFVPAVSVTTGRPIQSPDVLLVPDAGFDQLPITVN